MFFYDFEDRQALQRWQKCAAECQRRLTEQQILPGNPATILQDVATWIWFIGPDGILTKSRNATLPPERLPELNAKISYPIVLALKRALLRDYPNLAGLFVLLRVMDLLQMQGKRLTVNPAALELWRSLNLTEQYFALLEALLFQAQSSVLGAGNDREDAEAFGSVTAFLSQLSERWRNFDTYQAIYVLGSKGFLPPWKLFLLQQLGLIEIRPRKASEEERKFSGGRGWLIGGARLTPWGEAVTWALLEFRKQEEAAMAEQDEAGPGRDAAARDLNQEEEELAPDESEPEPEFGILQPLFQPYFPEWQKVYERPRHGARPGTYIFKVRLSGWRKQSGVWRRLAVPADTDLEALAGTILGAFNFDSDHLYDFRYRDERGRSRVYNHPFSDEGPWTTSITVGETELGLKDEMLFTFDYGDNWEFAVRLERIDTGPSRLRRPKVIESAGKAPEQYPQAEEW